MAKTTTDNSLQSTVQRLSRLHYLFIAALAVQIIVYDAWQLITPVAILQRWTATLLLMSAVTAFWYLSHGNRSETLVRRLLFFLIMSDIAYASFAVYNQRGMASRAVFLFAIPILLSAAIRRGAAVIATALVCIAAYVAAAISYFILNFNEGYSVELYGEVGFYSGMFLVLAMLVNGVTNRDEIPT